MFGSNVFVCETQDLEFWVGTWGIVQLCRVHGNTLSAGNWLHARLPFRERGKKGSCVSHKDQIVDSHRPGPLPRVNPREGRGGVTAHQLQRAVGRLWRCPGQTVSVSSHVTRVRGETHCKQTSACNVHSRVLKGGPHALGSKIVCLLTLTKRYVELFKFSIKTVLFLTKNYLHQVQPLTLTITIRCH